MLLAKGEIPLPEAEAVGRKWRQLVETRRSPALGSSSHVEAKGRMWFPTLWRPRKICILAPCKFDLEISAGLEPEGAGLLSMNPQLSLALISPLSFPCPSLPLQHHVAAQVQEVLACSSG